MRNLTRMLTVAAGLAAIAAAPAAAKKTHSYSAKLASATLTTDNGYPAVDGTAVFAGMLATKPFGQGALVDRVAITGVQGNVVSFMGIEVDFLADGSLRNTLSGTSTVRDDGTQEVVVNGRITGGTGRYKGATGSYRFTGATPAGSTVLNGTSKGSVSF